MTTLSPLTVALRAFAQRPAVGTDGRRSTNKPRRPNKRQRTEPHRFLVFDTETTTDTSQRLTFGVWRYYVDDPDTGLPLATCIEEGVFYAGDLLATDPGAFHSLVSYVDSRRADTFPGRGTRLRLLSRSEFVEQVLFRYGVRQRATIVGFNLPFDLIRLAIGAGHARGRNYGGVSLQLWTHNGGDHQYRPRITIKSIDSRRHLIAFTATNDPQDETFSGRFLDCRTLTFALSDSAGSLESCFDRFGIDFEKRDVTHGTVTDEYITYCREDVDATSHLAHALLGEHAQHDIELEPTRAYSPASIGKAYLDGFGLPPILQRQPDFPTDVLGFGMAAFFGGRAECRIRRLAVPVVYCDFLSMYPTVNALMGNWDLFTAGRIDTIDNTGQVRRLLQRGDLVDWFFNPEAWRDLACLVQVRLDGDIVPVRAAYDPGMAGYGIGVNPTWSAQPAWYALADVVASTILTGKAPEILRAIKLTPRGRQRNLCPLKLRGRVAVDPATDDFFRTVIEQRTATRNKKTLDDVERYRTQRFLKVLANATSYGVLAEFVTTTTPNPRSVEVWSDTGDKWQAATANPETPGRFCFPPLAACITAAARLMLALLEHQVTAARGSYVFCDTDSMAIVATRHGDKRVCDEIAALSWDEADQIVNRFETLNPYDPALVPGSILKIEDENYAPDGTRRELQCLAISAKRYALYLPAEDGVEIIKASEHGLGHLLPPTGGSVSWIDEGWRFLLAQDLNIEAVERGWLDRPALSRLTVSGSAVWRWFDHYNRDRAFRDQVRPGNFLAVAFPDKLTDPDAAPIAPFATTADGWNHLGRIDRHTGHPIRLTVAEPDGSVSGAVRVQTYRDVLSAFLAHPEHKSLAPDGRPVGRATTGRLRRRPIQAIWPPRYIGKEANRIDDQARGIIDDHDQVLADHTPTDHDWQNLVLPYLRTLPRSDVAAAVGVSRRSLERWLSGTNTPHPATRRAATAYAVAQARTQISANRRRTPDQRTVLWLAIQQTEADPSANRKRNSK